MTRVSKQLRAWNAFSYLHRHFSFPFLKAVLKNSLLLTLLATVFIHSKVEYCFFERFWRRSQVSRYKEWRIYVTNTATRSNWPTSSATRSCWPTSTAIPCTSPESRKPRPGLRPLLLEVSSFRCQWGSSNAARARAKARAASFVGPAAHQAPARLDLNWSKIIFHAIFFFFLNKMCRLACFQLKLLLFFRHFNTNSLS